jgi:signal transduction histidine kinase
MWFAQRPIRIRITLAFLLAMAILLLASGAFIYERMQFALDRSIHDVPTADRAELLARRRHRNEALDELLAQLAIAYTATLAIAGFVGYRLTRAALDPVEAMQRQASAVSPPGTHVRLDVPATNDEFSRLARTLNTLLAATQRAVERERRFIADASHELRTPLSLLKLQVDLALSRDRSPEELEHALERVRTETDRLVRLANNLLLIAQADERTLELTPRPVALHDALVEAAARFSDGATTDRRDICIDAASDDAVIAADHDRLQQALTNLIDNALRHGAGDVRLSVRRRDGFAVVHVVDDGPGLPEQFAATAFDRFSTASENRNSGAGLGLSIVKAIAEAHGGSAYIATRRPRGADVAIALPLANHQPPHSRRTSTTATTHPKQQRDTTLRRRKKRQPS